MVKDYTREMERSMRYAESTITGKHDGIERWGRETAEEVAPPADLEPVAGTAPNPLAALVLRAGLGDSTPAASYIHASYGSSMVRRSIPLSAWNPKVNLQVQSQLEQGDPT